MNIVKTKKQKIARYRLITLLPVSSYYKQVYYEIGFLGKQQS